MYLLPICTYLFVFVGEFCILLPAGLSVDKYVLSDLISVFQFYIYMYINMRWFHGKSYSRKCSSCQTQLIKFHCGLICCICLTMI